MHRLWPQVSELGTEMQRCRAGYRTAVLLRHRPKCLECNSESDREPVKLLEDGGDMVKTRGSGNDAGCRVLDQLKLMKGFVRGTEKE